MVKDRSLRFWHIAERGLWIQNPIGARHIRQLGRLTGLQPGGRVLDLGCGKGGPALILAARHGCRVVGIERSTAFVRQATRRFERHGLQDRIQLSNQDAREAVDLGPPFDLAICLGATFVLGGLVRTVTWLRERVVAQGRVAVGECFLRDNAPVAVREAVAGSPDGFCDLATTVEQFEAPGLRLVGVYGAHQADWDRYASTIWSNVERFVRNHPQDADNPYFLDRMRRMQAAYLGWEREYLGWALLVGRIGPKKKRGPVEQPEPR